jgi:hypothetical protein
MLRIDGPVLKYAVQRSQAGFSHDGVFRWFRSPV